MLNNTYFVAYNLGVQPWQHVYIQFIWGYFIDKKSEIFISFYTRFLKNGKLTIQKKLVISNIVVTKKVRYAVRATYMLFKPGTIQAQGNEMIEGYILVTHIFVL